MLCEYFFFQLNDGLHAVQFKNDIKLPLIPILDGRAEHKHTHIGENKTQQN